MEYLFPGLNFATRGLRFITPRMSFVKPPAMTSLYVGIPVAKRGLKAISGEPSAKIDLFIESLEETEG